MPGRSFPYRRLIEGLSLGAVLVVTVIRSIATTEVYYYDETAYLARGLGQSLSSRVPFALGPTFSDMYWVLGQAVDDRLTLYFLGRALSAATLVLAVWIAARLLTEPRLAWVAAACISVSLAPYIGPAVATPAAGILLVALALLFRWPGVPSLGAATGMVWIAAGSRPEYLWSALLLTVILSLWILRSALERRSLGFLGTRTGLSAVGGAVVIPALLIALHGSPFESDGRQWVAFSQHFALRNALPEENSWVDHSSITARTFGQADGITSAMRADPAAFVGHVASNLGDTIENTLNSVIGAAEPLVGRLWLVLGLGLVTSLAVAPRDSVSRLRARVCALVSPRYRVPLIVSMSVALSAAVPVVLFFPRSHYLLGFTAALAVGAVVAQYWVGSRRLISLVPLAPAVLVFSIYAMGVIETYAQRAQQPPPRTASIQTMNAVAVDWRLLGSEWGSIGMEVYVPRLTSVNAPADEGESFLEYLQRNRVNAVLVGEQLRERDVVTLPGFDAFASNPSAFGYSQIAPESGLWVLSDLLGRA